MPAPLVILECNSTVDRMGGQQSRAFPRQALTFPSLCLSSGSAEPQCPSEAALLLPGGSCPSAASVTDTH